MNNVSFNLIASGNKYKLKEIFVMAKNKDKGFYLKGPSLFRCFCSLFHFQFIKPFARPSRKPLASTTFFLQH